MRAFHHLQMACGLLLTLLICITATSIPSTQGSQIQSSTQGSQIQPFTHIDNLTDTTLLSTALSVTPPQLLVPLPSAAKVHVKKRLQREIIPVTCDFFLCNIADSPEASTLLVIGIVTLSIDIIAFLIALYNQDYPPLRAKQLFLVGMGLVAGCLWFFGFMHAAGMFVLSGFFSNCPLWTVVVQISLGTQLVLITIMLRLYRLYRVIVQQKPISGLDFRFWWSVILLPMVLTAAIALILPSEDVNYLDPATGVCQFNYVFKFAIMGVVFITIIIVGVFMLFVQSKIHISAFNEFRENRILFTIALVTLFVNFFCNVTSLYRSSWAQVSVAIIDLVAVHLNFWILLFGPLYACYFNREDYLMDFLIELNGLGRSTGSSGGEGNNSNI